jgi:hypothetical protein
MSPISGGDIRQHASHRVADHRVAEEDGVDAPWRNFVQVTGPCSPSPSPADQEGEARQPGGAPDAHEDPGAHHGPDPPEGASPQTRLPPEAAGTGVRYRPSGGAWYSGAA